MERIQPRDDVDWKLTESIVEGYAERHPDIMAIVAAKNEKIRQDLKTQFAEGEGNAQMRYVYEIPQGLKLGLETLFPLIFKEDNLKRFLNMYPLFQIPEKL